MGEFIEELWHVESAKSILEIGQVKGKYDMIC